MAKICYQARNFSADSLLVIERASEICDSYAEQGYDLDLRRWGTAVSGEGTRRRQLGQVRNHWPEVVAWLSS